MLKNHQFFIRLVTHIILRYTHCTIHSFRINWRNHRHLFRMRSNNRLTVYFWIVAHFLHFRFFADRVCTFDFNVYLTMFTSKNFTDRIWVSIYLYQRFESVTQSTIVSLFFNFGDKPINILEYLIADSIF